MASNNISTPSEKMTDEDSVSSSTTISMSESIIQDIIKNRKIFIITKNIEQRIVEILFYLQSDSNLATNKILIIEYLQSLFMSVEFNSEIFSRKFIKEKEKLNLYKILIHQYIFYTNLGNTKEDEENYRGNLQTLFILLLSQITLEKDSYQYIISSLINYMNEKNIINSKKKNNTNDFIENEPIINLKTEHISRILILLKYFYGYYKGQSADGVLNYFFFSGDSESSIVIHNKENFFDNNKKLLNLEETLCIMIFIKVLPSEYIKAAYPKINFKLLELKFNDKKKSICININMENQLTTPSSNEYLCQLSENEINCLLFKFNKKKSTINGEIYYGFKRVEIPPFQFDIAKDKNSKMKEEIKEIVLFKNFIGICSNIILYKEKKNEGLPSFLFNTDINNKLKSALKIDNKNDIIALNFSKNSLFPNGIYNEQLYSYFSNAEIKDQIDISESNINIDTVINYNTFKEFHTNNIISIYIPTRYIIPNQNEDKTISNNSQIILIDSINGLNAEFNTRSPTLNGIHIFQNLYEDDLSILGGLNGLLPILEFILNNNEFLTLDIFSSFFNLITVYIFCPKYHNALIQEDKSNFFKCLSYILEQIPDNFFNDELAENLKAILGFLCPPNGDNNFTQLSSQFHDYILINEKILFKFNEENQMHILNQIGTTARRNDININIIKIIKILLNYDKNRKNMFCCKEHCEYFNEKYPIMNPELSYRLNPIMKLLETILEKTYNENIKNYDENKENIINTNAVRKKSSNKDLLQKEENIIFNDNNIHLIFDLLTYDISPCLQNTIICPLSIKIRQYSYTKFSMIFDQNKELFDILLFVFKNSIFDIKIQTLDLILFIDRENNWNNLSKKDISIFIKNEILPLFLIDEANYLFLNNENNIIEKNEIKDEESIINKIRNEFNNDIIIEEQKKYGIRKDVEINGLKYNLYSPSETEKIIGKKYNKKKYNYLANHFFSVIFKYFQDADKVFDFVIKIISNGDLLLINSFLSKILGMIEDPEITKKVTLYNQLINNNYFLQFILDIYLHLYILINNKDTDKNFIPGFSLKIYKNSSNIPYEEKYKKEKINETYKYCEKIIKFILNEDITKFDYLLTWGKYYEDLKNENDIYQYAFDIIYYLVRELQLGSKKISTLSETSNINDSKVQTTLYFLNIFFEFFTFYNLKYQEKFFELNEKDINPFIKNDLKYILFNKNQGKYEPNPINELQTVDTKIDNIFFIKIVFSMLQPIWQGSDKKLLKNEDDVYTKYIYSFVNKNSFINELELLFHTFDSKFFYGNENDICNKGMKIIIILYHFFTFFLNLGGTKRELNEYFKDLRLFLLLLITAPPTINLADSTKKKKWLNEEQNEQIKRTIEIILFNIIFFLYHKIKEYKSQETEYNSKIEKEKDDETKNQNIENYKKNLECVSTLKRIYIENFGFILKILNKVYRGVKSDENQNKGIMNFFKNKNKIAERVKNTGAFSFINELYTECFISPSSKNKPNIKRKKTMQETTDSDISLNSNDTENKKEIKIERRIYKSLTSKNLLSYISEINNPELLNKENKDMKKDSSNGLVNLSDINDQENLNLSNLSFASSNSNTDIEENYLDEISRINYTPKGVGEILISDDTYKLLEILIDNLLENDNIKNYYQNNYLDRLKILYTFTSIMKTRQSKIKNIIPLFDNRKNIINYPYHLCLTPFYYPESNYKEILNEKMEKINKALNEEIKLIEKKIEIKENTKEDEYRNNKKKLFKFKGIWSNEEFFYDQKKYKLKYKLLNHYTNDMTKILLTPITDIDYYLPKFSKFKGDIFRTELSEASLIPITKITDICLYNKCGNINKNEIKNENVNLIPLYEYNQEKYIYMKKIEKENLIDYEKDFDLFNKYIEKKHLTKKGYSLSCEACLVKLSFHIRGIIYINYKEIGFYSYETKKTKSDEDYDFDKKVCFGSIFQEKTEKYKKYFLKIPFNKVEFIFRRRYYFKRNVLEIFTMNKKSYFFQINEKSFDKFYEYIILNNNLSKNNNEFEEITIETAKNEEKTGLINKSNILFEYNGYKHYFFGKKITTIKNLYIKWLHWEISTFTLLNYLNIFSSRSYHDINQYPVFPWIITDYTEKTIPDLSKDFNPLYNTSKDYVPKIRPLNTPMGMIDIIPEAKERKENYLIMFENKEEDMISQSDKYGSHYSTSLYLTYYLVRVFPFSYLRIEIQGKNFDDPNRLFNSLEDSFYCAITQKSDLRELIPEFFCLPEMFYNMNDLNLGQIYDEKTKTKRLVNDIEMPLWSSNDGYNFIYHHRAMLESIEISEKIHEWFNIIFGSKQKGKAAKKIRNEFMIQSYDDFDEKHQTSEPTDKIYQKRMVEFGVTPSQIFKNDVDKRLNIKNMKKTILFDYHIKKEKEKNSLFAGEEKNELKIIESELYLEGNPYKVFSSWKKDEHQKNEKIIFLYKDKIKIISKTEKSLFKKSKTNLKTYKETKEKATPKKEETELKEINEENEEINEEENYKENKENEITEEENTEITLNNKDISKFDKLLIYPKYRMDINHSPTLIYDKGNYIILGGFWNGQIIINKLEDNEKKSKTKTVKNVRVINTNKISPITLMKIDNSETVLICANKIGYIFIYTINKQNKLEWNLIKTIQDNQKEITAFDLNENLNIFITCDKEGYNNIYTFPECKLFNSYKLNENQLPANNSPNEVNTSVSRSESNLNIITSQNDLYSDIVIISHVPLPCIIFYIYSKRCLCSFSINFHLIKVKYNIDIIQNGIKKYCDYFNKEYLFVYNKKENLIDVYDTINLDLILRSNKLGYTFVDFCFGKEMENALILVKIDEDNNNINDKEKEIKNNYKILMLNSSGKGDNKTG